MSRGQEKTKREVTLAAVPYSVFSPQGGRLVGGGGHTCKTLTSEHTLTSSASLDIKPFDISRACVQVSRSAQQSLSQSF